MKLFSEEIPITEDVDVIKNKAAELNWSNAYAVISSFAKDPVLTIKNEIESWFQELSKFLDGEFIEVVKKEFHQRMWEIYCGKFLNERFGLIKKSEVGLPDFKIKIKGANIWVEATAPSNGDEKDGNKLFLIREEVAKKGKASYSGLISDRTDPVVLRLKAAIKKKYESYSSTYLNNGVESSDLFIIAVNSYLFDDGMHSDQVILQLFFGMGNQVVVFGGDPKKESEVLREQRNEAKSLKGVPVEVGMFQNSDYEYISAVIFSSRDVYNIERSNEKIGNDIFIIFNPFAKNKISPNDFTFCIRATADGKGVKFEMP